MGQNRRLIIQTKLEELLGSGNVYYQPPETLKMEYPAIRYSRINIDSKKANNKAYMLSNQYQLIVIDRRPDNPVINKLLELPYSSFERSYKSDNLYHDIINLYF